LAFKNSSNNLFVLYRRRFRIGLVDRSAAAQSAIWGAVETSSQWQRDRVLGIRRRETRSAHVLLALPFLPRWRIPSASAHHLAAG